MPTVFTGQPVEEIEGIGPSLSQSLAGMGIKKIEDLLALDVNQMRNLLSGLPGVTEAKLRESFIPQARFLRLDGMTGQFAGGLVKSGFRTYSSLMNEATDEVYRRLEQRHSQGDIPSMPPKELVQQWQLDSARKSQGGSLHIRIYDRENRKPISGAVVRINGTGLSDDNTPLSRETDSDGLVFLDTLGKGVHRVSISCNGYQTWLGTFSAAAGSHSKLVISIKKGTDQPLFKIDEFQGEVIVSASPTDAVIFKTFDAIDEFPKIPPFQVVSFSEATDTVLLTSIWKQKINDQIFVYQLRQPKSLFPKKVAKGNVVVRKADGAYRVIKGLTPGQFRRELVRRRLSNSKGGD